MFLASLSNIRCCSYVDPCLDLLFYSNDLHISFCASTILVLLLYLYNISWIQEWPRLLIFFAQDCFGCSGFIVIPYECYFFLSLWRVRWGFWWLFHWICKLILLGWFFLQYSSWLFVTGIADTDFNEQQISPYFWKPLKLLSCVPIEILRLRLKRWPLLFMQKVQGFRSQNPHQAAHNCLQLVFHESHHPLLTSVGACTCEVHRQTRRLTHNKHMVKDF